MMMKKTLFVSLLAFICHMTIHSQEVYVDSNTGSDSNEGTKGAPVFSIHKAAEIIKNQGNGIFSMKINPGIYVLDSSVSVTTDKDMIEKRIVIEASILPDSTSWTPAKMPVIVSIAKKDNNNRVVGFSINEDHVTIRGLKFLGYFYPISIYFPIARLNRVNNDLLVEQCLFSCDFQTTVIQVGVIAHGNEVKVDHCVFYNANNSVVFYYGSQSNIKTGNSMTNCIVYGACESGVWVASPDSNFIYKNNIVSNCNFSWIQNGENHTIYSVDSSIVVNNQHKTGDGNLSPTTIELNENNVIEEGNISLRMLKSVFSALPKDHLHIMLGTLGSDMGAGLFKKKKAPTTVKLSVIPKKSAFLQCKPNPLSRSTNINFYLDKPVFTKLIIYNLSGQVIKTLINGNQKAGHHEITWETGGITNGTYLCKLQTADNQTGFDQQFSEAIKLIIQN
jgi:hypothetical protein